MNWLDRRVENTSFKLGLIITLLALILFSCEEPTQLGGDMIPGEDTVGVFTVELPVASQIILRDSLWTESGSALVGNYNDPEFGLVTAESYANMVSGSLTKPSAISDTSTYDSLTLTLKVSYAYGSNVLSAQDLKIHQLSDSIRTGYTDPFSHNRQPVEGLLADTAIALNKTLYDKDTFFVQIKLSDDLGKAIYDSAKAVPDLFTNALRTIRAFKGIAFSADETSTAVFGFDLNNSFVTLHYHHSRDTLEYPFRLNNFAYSYMAADRSGTVLAGLNEPDEPFDPDNNGIFVQGGIGITSLLDFSSFLKVKDSVGNLIVNNATLYIEAEPFPAYIEPPQNLNVLVSDSTGAFAYSESEDPYTRDTLRNYFTISRDGSLVASQSSFTVPYDKSRTRYSMDLTRFMQQVGNNENRYRYLMLNPLIEEGLVRRNPRTYVSIAAARLNRLVAAPENIKLKVYYTALR